jgi:HlyD family secretion protein
MLLTQANKQCTTHEIKGSGTIESTEIEIGSRLGGRVADVFVEEGQSLDPGDVLLQFEAYQLPGQRAQLTAQLAQAQANLAALKDGPRPQEVAAAKAQYLSAKARASIVQSGARAEDIAQATAARKQAEAESQLTHKQFERFEQLLSKRVISQSEFDSAQANWAGAQEKLRIAKEREQALITGNRPQEIQSAQEQANAQFQQWQLLQQGSRPESIAAQAAMVQSIQAQLAQLDTAGTELAVKSPCACELSVFGAKPGQLILPNQSLATLTALDDIWIRIYVPETRLGEVMIGQKAKVDVDAFPGKHFEAKVVAIGSKTEFTPKNVQTEESRKAQVVAVKVAIQNPKHQLRPGMLADVRLLPYQR